MDINRRKFIQTISVATGGALFLPACSGAEDQWHYFTQAEAETVIAIAEQIIPADKDPGATEAGVINFIDRQLAGFYSNFQETYSNGLATLQQYCMGKYHELFEKLDYEKQTEVLKLLEKNSIEGDYWKDNPSSQFFKLLCDHTMQGFYGSPRHGGNKNYASFKMIGIDYPPVLGQNRYAPRCKTLNIYQK